MCVPLDISFPGVRQEPSLGPWKGFLPAAPPTSPNPDQKKSSPGSDLCFIWGEAYLNRCSICLLKDWRENKVCSCQLSTCLTISFTKMQRLHDTILAKLMLPEDPGTHDPAAQEAPALAQMRLGKGQTQPQPPGRRLGRTTLPRILGVGVDYISQGDSDSPWDLDLRGFCRWRERPPGVVDPGSTSDKSLPEAAVWPCQFRSITLAAAETPEAWARWAAECRRDAGGGPGLGRMLRRGAEGRAQRRNPGSSVGAGGPWAGRRLCLLGTTAPPQMCPERRSQALLPFAGFCPCCFLPTCSQRDTCLRLCWRFAFAPGQQWMCSYFLPPHCHCPLSERLVLREKWVTWFSPVAESGLNPVFGLSVPPPSSLLPALGELMYSLGSRFSRKTGNCFLNRRGEELGGKTLDGEKLSRVRWEVKACAL